MLRVAFATQTRKFASTALNINELKELLRRTAQPVAIATSILPNSSKPLAYHGATLSSVSSIAMEPYPLVAFSIRVPSRMATSLKHKKHDLVLNLLSAAQAQQAFMFSNPHAFPNPFLYAEHSLTDCGLPILHDSLGALKCRLISTLPLHDLDYLEGNSATASATIPSGSSEMFLARVLSLENVPRNAETSLCSSPLIYYEKDYTTCTKSSTCMCSFIATFASLI